MLIDVNRRLTGETLQLDRNSLGRVSAAAIDPALLNAIIQIQASLRPGLGKGSSLAAVMRIITQNNQALPRHLIDARQPVLDRIRAVGAGELEGGLDDQQVDEIVKLDPVLKRYYGGTILLEDLDNLRLPKLRATAMTLHVPWQLGGTEGHWVGLIADPKRRVIEYYDSFADEIPPAVRKQLNRLIKRNYPGAPFVLKTNQLRQQSVSTQNCGYFVLRFLARRMRDQEPGAFARASGFDDFVREARAGGIGPIEESERIISQYKKKFSKLNIRK